MLGRIENRTILMVGLATAFVILCYRFYKVNVEYARLSSSLDQCEKANQSNVSRLNTVTGDVYLQFLFEGKKVIELDSDLKKKVFASGKAEKGFFYFNDEDCEACINSLVNDIRTLGEEIGNSRVTILSNYTDNREPTYIYHKLEKKVEVYNLSGTGTRVDSLFRRLPPSVFISDSTMVVRCLYVYKPREVEVNRVVFNSYKNRFMNPKVN